MEITMKRLTGLLASPIKCIAWLALFGTVVLHASIYYVATTGSDNAGGSSAAPYKTIQKAAGVMQAGDSCYIRAGVYRETFTPANSGTAASRIVFTAYPNEKVIISGADVITGWSVHSGSIYKAAMGWDMGEGKNQVFVNGQMMLQARYPNTGLDLLHPTLFEATVVKASDYIDCRGLVQEENYYTGGLVWACVDPRWTAQTAKITASSTVGRLTITNKSGTWTPEYGNGYGRAFITGLLKLLDAPTEWHYETSMLYLWTQTSANPTDMLVEAKRRDVIADLSGRSYITLSNLNFFSGRIKITGNNNIVSYCTGKYIQHYTLSSGWGGGSGNEVGGSENLVANSDFSYSAGNAFNLSGTHNTILNCVIHEVAYNGNYASCINMGGTRCVVSRNTLYNSGRWIWGHSGTLDTIIYNHAFNYGYLTEDLGALYTYGHDGQFTRIAYNWIHDNYCYYAASGIYVDDNARNYVVDHNVIWHNAYPIFVKGFVRAYNNTTFQNLHQTGFNEYVSTNSDVRNALDLYVTPETQLNDYVNFDFRPKQGAAAIDAGTVIPGYTDTYLGPAPDLGAYEYGATNWTAGSVYMVADPVISPRGGSFSGPVTITIVSATQGNRIYYTTNGQEPTEMSAPYGGPFTLAASAIVKARAFKTGRAPSLTTSAPFMIGTAVPVVAITSPSNGTMYAAPATIGIGAGVAGQGRALVFDKSKSQYVKIFTNAVPRNNFSFELWFKTADSNASFSAVRNTPPDPAYFSAQKSYSLELISGNISYTMGSAVTSTGKNYADNAWHHAVVVVQVGAGTKIYVDGTISASTTNDYIGPTFNEYFCVLGCKDSRNFFNGSLDEIRLYSRCLTQSEVTAHYNNGKGEFGTTTTDLFYAFHCDEGTGPELLEYAGSANILGKFLINEISWGPSTVGGSSASVAKMEFFQGTTKLGESVTYPYNLSWSNVPVGEYTLTAKATFTDNSSQVSGPTNIIVSNGPLPVKANRLFGFMNTGVKRTVKGWCISVAEKGNHTIEIVDVQGHIIRTFSGIGALQYQLTKKEISDSIYVVRIRAGNKSIVRKIIAY